MAGFTTEMVSSSALPEVAESLRPYIFDRHYVAAVRGYLHFGLSVTSIDAVHPRSKKLALSPTTSGIRISYWKALQAHREAQAKYDKLKADLDLYPAGGTTSQIARHEAGDPPLTETYLPLLRQREKHRKLVVLERALGRVHAAGGDALTESFDDVVKNELGDLPSPPTAATLSDREPSSAADVSLARLKTAILAERRALNEHEEASIELDQLENGEADPHAELSALQAAHSELTTWMETQLALISQVGSSADVNQGAPLASLRSDTESNIEDNIEALYEQYLEARQRLLEIVTNPPSPPEGRDSSPVVFRRDDQGKEAEQRVAASETILPYVKHLTSTKQQEQNLLRQTIHMRRQLASADAQNGAMLARLADESHLLQHDISRGGPRGSDWKQAGDAAGAATRDFASKRLEAGRFHFESASQALQAIEKMPSSLGALVE